MNLHAIVAGAVSSVNPSRTVTLQTSNGNTENADGSVTPNYNAPIQVQAQIQSLTFRDLQQLDGLNLQGTRRAMYLSGEVDGIIRVNQKGGDLITTADGQVWLTAQVLEQWFEGDIGPAWCKVAVTLQDGS